MNVPSDNFVAEQLARGVAAERDDGTWDAWSKAATDFLESCGAGPCRIRDGSGLSRYNLLTAEGIVALLERVQQEPWSEAFFDSLPAPGEGTLENRLADVPGVRAKTGTITGSSALSGVVQREYQSDVVFSVIFGGLTVGADEARRRQDEFVRALV
jgi:D-alanyl-D-alanine carboxypeptidase/D-alanyl-D-alanine-endopeptidase (penicillin-binding protein 4)